MGASHSRNAGEWHHHHHHHTLPNGDAHDDPQHERQRLVLNGQASVGNTTQTSSSILRPHDPIDLGDSDDGEHEIDLPYDMTPTTATGAAVSPESPRAVDRFEPIGHSPSESDSALHTDMSLALPPTPRSGAVADDIAASDGTADENKFHILLLMSDTGGGHRASAQALEAAFDAQYPGQVRISTVDFWTTVAGWPFHNFPAQYTFIAKRPILWKIVYIWAALRPTRALTEFVFSLFGHGSVRRYFENAQPDLVLSVHPLVNRLSLSVLQAMQPPAPPFVTVVTDLGDAHPTWFDQRADMVYVPSNPLRQIALEQGVRQEHIRLLGLPVRPAFWHAPPERQLLRAKLGMAQHIPAVLLVGGGDGVGGMAAIADAIALQIAEQAGAAAGQLVVVCGKNKSLLAKMRARSWPVPVILKGFVNNMSDWMSACDILCSKAGPGTIAEAWIRGLPIILTGFLPGQEEGNVTLVTESGSGEFHTRADDIARCAARWVVDAEERAAVANRARNLGRPNSTMEIAGDIWTLGQRCAKEREMFRRRLQSAPPQAQIPNGYIAMTRYYIGSAVRSVHRGFLWLFGRGDYQLARPN